MSREDNVGPNPRLLVRPGPHWPAEHRYVLDVLLGEHLGLVYDAESVAGLGLGPEQSAARLAALWSTIRRLGGTLEVLIHNCHPLAVWLAQTLARLKPA